MVRQGRAFSFFSSSSQKEDRTLMPNVSHGLFVHHSFELGATQGYWSARKIAKASLTLRRVRGESETCWGPERLEESMGRTHVC